MKILHELLRCAGYYIVMIVTTSILIPPHIQAPLNKVSAGVIIIAFIINIVRLLLGGDDSSSINKIGSKILMFIFAAYIILLLACLAFNNLGEALVRLFG